FQFGIMKPQSRLIILMALVSILLAFWFIRSRDLPTLLSVIAENVRNDFSATIKVSHSTPSPRIDITTRFKSSNANATNQIDINRQETKVALNLSPQSQSKAEGALPSPGSHLITSRKNERFKISGTVSIHGDLPTEKSLPLDAICSLAFEERFPGETPTTRFFVTSNGGLGDVLVTIIEIDEQSSGLNALEHVIDQSGCQFHPYVSACQTGQTIKIINSDPALHSVIATPRSEGNQAFTAAQIPDSPPLLVTFDEPEEFLRFKSNVHPWMYSYVSVMDHPFFDVTSPDGTFAINDLPNGRYQLKAKHRKAGEIVKEIEIDSSEVVVDFEFSLD
ncbi:hypothetical protein OAG52_03805, partial [Verrucomicrobia bacterium]|nr:hypothetical protein [Verrucomicrobiota bacterium]